MHLGYYHEQTGDPKDGNYYCEVCPRQVPVGFKHHHASEVPALKKKIAALEIDRERMDFLDKYGYEFLRWVRKELKLGNTKTKTRNVLDEYRLLRESKRL